MLPMEEVELIRLCFWQVDAVDAEDLMGEGSALINGTGEKNALRVGLALSVSASLPPWFFKF